jgi:protein Tex
MPMTNRLPIVTSAAHELGLEPWRVEAVATLLDDGATVPFIARYRKERTGGMDEVELRAAAAALERHASLAARREAMRSSLGERGMLSEALEAALNAAATMTELEDTYLPYRPKRVTRASKARERGLEPLAELMLRDDRIDPASAAAAFVDPELGVASVDDALAGARDIIAERVSEERETRAAVRALFERGATITSERSRREKENPEAATYRDYFAWSEPAARAPSHRVLAMLRGERNGFLTVHVAPSERAALDVLRRRWVGGARPRAEQMERAVADAYDRLIRPSLESEQKKQLFLRASESSAEVFSANLRDLLLAPPLGEKRILAIDPGFRTGCKVVCLDEHGELLHSDTIFPLEPKRRTDEASRRITSLAAEHRSEAIAVGNGTGGRETVQWLAALGSGAPPVITVNESGASVYSASDIARKELPDHDVTVRGAVSIGRRLMDPLSELVKIDPRSIGVGQYQHDIDAELLERRLAETVESCVNLVGADLNTASVPLLRFISGISEKVAQAIVVRRDAGGGFTDRAELTGVPGVGAKTFEQAAGFLRIRGGTNPLDSTAVHPERYELVRRMAGDLGVEVDELIGNEQLVKRIRLADYVDDEVGMPTLQHVADELGKPGRDPRPAFSTVAFSEAVHEIGDLRIGMQLPGIVTNVTDFGAFVDIGVHRDGLVHISKLARDFVRNPREVVRVGQAVDVTVIDVDPERKRISLSMVDAGEPEGPNG